MARRMSRSQFRSKQRQAEQKQRQAINRYNAAARKFNRETKRAVDDHNRKTRAHNATVRTNRQRLGREFARLNSSSGTTRYVVYRRSVVTLQESFERIEASAEAGTWQAGSDLFDLSEGETANSVAVLNSLLTDTETDEEPDVDESLQSTTITSELAEISPELKDRWHGALFSLNPKNPDAARHFCTSAREILTAILEAEAPDEQVLATNPQADITHDGQVTRRARIRHCLERRDSYDADLEVFVDADIDNVIELFRDFNQGTHGDAGRYTVRQLTVVKKRVEDAILFLHRIVR